MYFTQNQRHFKPVLMREIDSYALLNVQGLVKNGYNL